MPAGFHCVFTSLWYVGSQSPIVHHYVISLWWTQYVRNNRALRRNNKQKHSEMKRRGDERSVPSKYEEIDEFREKEGERGTEQTVNQVSGYIVAWIYFLVSSTLYKILLV